MFDAGFWELLVVVTIVLLVLGPERLPGFVAGLGRWIGRARALATGLRMQMEREVMHKASAAPPPNTAATNPPGDATAETEPAPDSRPRTSDNPSPGPHGQD